MKREKVSTTHSNEEEAIKHMEMMKEANPQFEFYHEGNKVYWYSNNWSKDDE